MGASNVLSRRSNTQGDTLPTIASAARYGVATFVGFITAGLVPLLAYLLPWFEGIRFIAASALALTTLFVVVASRASFAKRGWFGSGLEMPLLSQRS
jgi:VIT1/CCC1 family predicted Fe2+/Mn2+ transporter